MAQAVPNFATEKNKSMGLIHSLEEFNERRERLNTRLAEVAQTCWNYQCIPCINGEYHYFPPKTFALKDKRRFYKAVREIFDKTEILHLYMAAIHYFPSLVDYYAKRYGFTAYKSMMRVRYDWSAKSTLACCWRHSNFIEFQFYYLLLGNERAIRSTILHELCHTVYHNHKMPFWELFEEKMKEEGLISQDYDGWEMHFYYDPRRLYSLPRGWYMPLCVPCKTAEDYKNMGWDIFYDETLRYIRSVIRKRIDECGQDGSYEDFMQMYNDINPTDKSSALQ